MSFYDDNFYGSRKYNKKRGSSFFTAFFSAIIGGLIVLLLLPTLVNLGLIDINISQETSNPLQNEQISSDSKQVLVDINTGIVQAAEKVKPTVVGVVNIQEQNNKWSRTTRNVEAGFGTGFVVDKKDGKAYIVTNYHVIERAKGVEVSLANGERVSAEIIGSDELTDLAVIAIDEKYIEAVAILGDSTNLRPGEPAIAIGNPLGLEFSQSVTVGVVSSTNRTIPKDLNGDNQADWETEVIQTDAAINRGNSGGPLVNIEGYVIGINSAKIAESGVEGLGFAIPISDAKPIIDKLIKYGKVKYPYMGIELYDLHNVSQKGRIEALKLPESVNEGVVLEKIKQLGPSSLAGLEPLDVIVKLDNQQISNSSDLRKYLYKDKKVGEIMKVTFYRGGELQTVEVKLVDLPKNQ